MPPQEGSVPKTVYDHLQSRGRFALDSQARSLYDAERRFGTEPPPGHERFGNVREATAWARVLSSAPEFVAAYPQAAEWLAANPVSVKRAAGRQKVGCAWPGTGEISLSSADDGVGMVLPIMVHEFSHIVHGQLPAEKFQQAHGPEFAAVYLDMVALVCGDDTADRLQQDFKDRHVNVAGEARRVRSAGAGLTAAGRLPRPTKRRTPESVAAVRDAQFVRKAEREARKALDRYNADGLRSFVALNRGFFERAAAAGADLPAALRRHLPAASQPTRQTQHAQRQPPPREPRRRAVCGKWMPKARRPCARPPRHNGGCR